MKYTIRIPEHVEVDFDLAGPMARFGALLCDTLIIMVLLFVLFLAVVAMGLLPRNILDLSEALAVSWAAAVYFLLAFLLFWGYYVLFEHFLRGRTPGKMIFRLRVLCDDGFPVGLRECAIRNLARAADMMPIPFYLVGGLAALYHPHGKRLGDMAAGTIVVREGVSPEPSRDAALRSSAGWLARVEAGRSRQAVTLPRGKIDSSQIGIIRQFMSRRFEMDPAKRSQLAWRIARPFLELMGEEPEGIERRGDRRDYCEAVLRQILDLASQPGQQSTPSEKESVQGEAAERKRRQWTEFSARVSKLLHKGRRTLRRLSPYQLEDLIASYRRINADLARARSLGAEPAAVEQLNRIALIGHNFFYGYAERPRGSSEGGTQWLSAFPRAVRRSMGAVAVSTLLFFAPAAVSYFAVMWNPGLGYDLVGPGFIDFQPAREENLHDIPALMRPVAASGIMTNNMQVALLAFGLGLTAGIGTILVLVQNGVHLGSVAGWMALQGNSRALWGWIMPHGGTELLAIVLAGAAGLILAEAVIAPGRLSRTEALKRCAPRSLTIALGVLVMLIFAGLVEGFVSPSSMSYPGRIAFLLASLAMWGLYLGLYGLDLTQRRGSAERGERRKRAHAKAQRSLRRHEGER